MEIIFFTSPTIPTFYTHIYTNTLHLCAYVCVITELIYIILLYSYRKNVQSLDDMITPTSEKLSLNDVIEILNPLQLPICNIEDTFLYNFLEILKHTF